MLCSNRDLKVDSQEICTGIIGVPSDRNMKAKVGEAFQQPSNMAGTVEHSDGFCFGS